jgi:hypothetical protein
MSFSSLETTKPRTSYHLYYIRLDLMAARIEFEEWLPKLGKDKEVKAKTSL